MVHTAYNQPRTQTVYVAQPTPVTTAQPSVEQRLRQLDNLAEKGYITPQEYKAKKQAILDNL